MEVVAIFRYVGERQDPVVHDHVDTGFEHAQSEQGFRDVLHGVAVAEFVRPHRTGDHDRDWWGGNAMVQNHAGLCQRVGAVQHQNTVGGLHVKLDRFPNLIPIVVGEIERVLVHDRSVFDFDIRQPQLGEDLVQYRVGVAELPLLFVVGLFDGTAGGDDSEFHGKCSIQKRSRRECKMGEMISVMDAKTLAAYNTYGSRSYRAALEVDCCAFVQLIINLNTGYIFVRVISQKLLNNYTSVS